MDFGDVTKITEEHVFIDDCIGVRRSSLIEENLEFENLELGDTAVTRARRAVSIGNLITSSRYNIRVFISNTFTTAQRTIIMDALDTWENISGLDFSVVTNLELANIRIIMDTDTRIGAPAGFVSLSSIVCGVAEAPSNGIPGMWISINDNFPHDDDQFLATVTHEIGHTIGFDHSNSSSSVIQCTSSSSSNNCNSSLMVAECCGNRIDNLTNDEQKAVGMMYPDNYSPVITAHEVKYQTQSTREVTLNFNSLTEKAYQIEIMRYYPSGTLTQTYYTGCYSNGIYSLTTTPWPGEWKFKVRYKNMRGDVTGISPFYTVDMSL